jgi:hypothetical protein
MLGANQRTPRLGWLIMAKRNRTGYGQRPLHSRWRKGKSGNPAGKPQGTRNRASPMSASFNKLVEIVRADGRRVGFRNQLTACRIILALAHGDVPGDEPAAWAGMLWGFRLFGLCGGGRPASGNLHNLFRTCREHDNRN